MAQLVLGYLTLSVLHAWQNIWHISQMSSMVRPLCSTAQSSINISTAWRIAQSQLCADLVFASGARGAI